MFNLNKLYKTKAMAVNAIRMTATNKGWTTLNTDQAAEHVWPQGELFAVNNTTLNEAYGFTSAEDVELATNKASPEVTQAINEALAEQHKADAKTPKLQTASKMEQSKKENLAPKKPYKPQTVKVTGSENTDGSPLEKRETRCNVVNGARRPLRGKTLLVWEVAESLYAQMERVPTAKEVYAQLLKSKSGFNKTTCSIQYYACVAYNGWKKEKQS